MRVALKVFLQTCGVLVSLFLSAPGQTHEVPDQVTVLSYVKPEGNTLTLLLRAPMSSLRDIDVPVQDNGFLALSRIELALQDGAQVWLRDFIDIYENGQLLPTPRFIGARVSLPTDRSFESYEQALAHTIATDLPLDTPIRWDEGVLDVAYEYPIQSADSDFSINPGLTRLGLQVNIGLRFFTADGTEHVFDVHPEVGVVQLDPSWTQAFYFFAREGFFHILSGPDHLLFLFALVIPFRRLAPLAGVATAFTVGHSITLISSAFGLAPTNEWFPYIIEMLIAVSILYMALENIIGAKIERRWWVALAFGMVHGFGFSFLLTERLQFAGDHLLPSLLAFNVGVELGQLVFLGVALSGLTLLFRFVAPARVGGIILSAFVAHSAWQWTVERWGGLAGTQMPDWQELVTSGILWWAMGIVGAAFVFRQLSKWWPDRTRASSSLYSPSRLEGVTAKPNSSD